ncbi:MAG: CBS domain-containing protein [Acetobacteraceae bacterium]|nr:CBS domain-containing protein [Acetobacteraceae bacterium]
MNIAAILKYKGREVVSVDPRTPVTDIIEVLTRHRIGAVVVNGAAGELLGILGERDIIRALNLHGPRALELTADQLMSASLFTATPRMSVIEAMGVMTQHRVRHLPVIEENRVIGLISIGDIVQMQLVQHEQEVDSLRAYVAGAEGYAGTGTLGAGGAHRVGGTHGEGDGPDE